MKIAHSKTKLKVIQCPFQCIYGWTTKLLKQCQTIHVFRLSYRETSQKIAEFQTFIDSSSKSQPPHPMAWIYIYFIVLLYSLN